MSEYINQLKRQRNRCLGCQEYLTGNPFPSQDVATKRLRGFLCQSCNMVLRLVKENGCTLYRLAAHLTLDRTKTLIYVIGSLKNENIPKVGDRLREIGLDALENWWSSGPEADMCWQMYEKNRGHSFKEALASRESQNVFRFDRAYLDLCDAAVLVLPAGRSGHLELSYVIGRDKPGFILMDGEPKQYDQMY